MCKLWLASYGNCSRGRKEEGERTLILCTPP